MIANSGWKASDHEAMPQTASHQLTNLTIPALIPTRHCEQLSRAIGGLLRAAGVAALVCANQVQVDEVHVRQRRAAHPDTVPIRRPQAKQHNETVLLRATTASMRRAEAAAQTAAKSGERLARARALRRASVELIREKAVKVLRRPSGRLMSCPVHCIGLSSLNLDARLRPKQHFTRAIS